MNVMIIIFYAPITCKPLSASAQYNLGVRYKNGGRLSQDYLQVNAWYERAGGAIRCTGTVR